MELTVISGKGGTGKTTIAMALSKLFESKAISDCDVDAANLYLYLKGNDIKKEYFYAGKLAHIDERFCTQCGECEKACKFEAIKDFKVNPYKCEGCLACSVVCPSDAIVFKDEKAADAFVTKTANGHLTRARMEVGADGSGKLITMLRKNTRNYAEADDVIIIDGSPGIGCPVISSITGSDAVLIVTEPTMSGLSDFERISELCAHFGILTLACINKFDINEDMVVKIEQCCAKSGIKLVGKIPYDDTVMESVNNLKPITDYKQSSANKAIRAMFENIKDYADKIIKEQTGEDDYQ